MAIIEIDAPTVKAWLSDGGEIALLDVREAGQFGEGHPFFAVPLPYSRFELGLLDLVPNPDVRLVLADGGDGIATRAAANSAGLDFVPLQWEHFDLLMRQRSYFRPAMQALIGFLGGARLKQHAAELTGYDATYAGQIRFAA